MENLGTEVICRRLNTAGRAGIFHMEYSIRNKTKVKRPNTPLGKLDVIALGARVREVRGKRRQEEFATSLGISQGQLSKLEQGKVQPNAALLLRLCAVSSRTADWFLKG